MKEKGKLSFKETRELESLPEIIETLDEERSASRKPSNSPEFYASRDLDKVYAANDRLRSVEKELDEAYRRWEELESLAARLRGSQE